MWSDAPPLLREATLLRETGEAPGSEGLLVVHQVWRRRGRGLGLGGFLCRLFELWSNCRDKEEDLKKTNWPIHIQYISLVQYIYTMFMAKNEVSDLPY